MQILSTSRPLLSAIAEATRHGIQPISIGTFTKTLGLSDLCFNALVLAVFVVSRLIPAQIMLKSAQEADKLVAFIDAVRKQQ